MLLGNVPPYEISLVKRDIWLQDLLIINTTKMSDETAFVGSKNVCHNSGADPGFQVRGAHLKKSRRAEGGAKIWRYFVWKITILRKKNHIFFNFRGSPVRPIPPGSAPAINLQSSIEIIDRNRLLYLKNKYIRRGSQAVCQRYVLSLFIETKGRKYHELLCTPRYQGSKLIITVSTPLLMDY